MKMSEHLNDNKELFSYQTFLTYSHFDEVGLRKEPIFCNSTNGFPVKWCLRN